MPAGTLIPSFFLGAMIQLIINHKLKVYQQLSSHSSCPIGLQSVAHMPMKAMIYKTLSTVVDNFFA